VADGFGPRVEDLLEPEKAVDEILRIGCRGCSTGRLQPRDVTRAAVFFSELLDASAANVELLGDQAGVHVVINNPLTDSGDIILVELHFTWSIIGQIMATRSLAYSTLLTPTGKLI
jgi:hypothetical protein